MKKLFLVAAALSLLSVPAHAAEPSLYNHNSPKWVAPTCALGQPCATLPLAAMVNPPLHCESGVIVDDPSEPEAKCLDAAEVQHLLDNVSQQEQAEDSTTCHPDGKGGVECTSTPLLTQ